MTTPTTPLEVWMIFKKDGRRFFAKLLLIHGVSHRQMADQLGWRSHSYVGRLARGEVTTVSPDTAARIAHILGVGVDDLFLVKARTSTVQDTHVKTGRAA